MMPTPFSHQNRLLAALPAADWQRWAPELERVDLLLGQVLHEPGMPLTHVYFPTTAIVSLQYLMAHGAPAGSAVVGLEGMVGIELFMGGEASMPTRAVVHCAGQGFRMRGRALQAEFQQPPVQRLLLGYTQALMAQMSQTAVCNRHHTLDRQLCRWLLLSLDRITGNQLVMTHELIANMLGVRREGVSEAALKLQVAGLIRYARGHISVLKRGALEERSCECYAVVKREYDRLLPEPVGEGVWADGPANALGGEVAERPFYRRPARRAVAERLVPPTGIEPVFAA